MNIKTTQLFLYLHPIFNWIPEAENDWDITIVGDTDWAAAFADLVLQLGQVPDKRLTISWYIRRSSTKNAYLKERPALGDFIAINGEQDDKYGIINFYPITSLSDQNQPNPRRRYMIVATEAGDYNEQTATNLVKSSRVNCIAAFAKEDRLSYLFRGKNDLMHYDAIAEEATNALERMAFNTHLIWEDDGNRDMNYTRERFNEPYYYNSSVSFVLSIPYKLRSIGVMNNADLFRSAARMDRLIRVADAKPESAVAKHLVRMAVYEHRRWVMEKVTSGVTGLTDEDGNIDYDGCVERCSYKIKDKKGRLRKHVGIVRCDSETLLKDGPFADHIKWDKTTNIKALDELDQVSILMHRAMNKKAKKVLKDQSVLNELTDKLQTRCSTIGPRAVMLGDRFTFAIKNIMDSSLPYSAQFETYKKMLLQCAPKLEPLVNSISEILYPVIEANQYRDYKLYDYELIRSIPFIITAPVQSHICMSLGRLISTQANNIDYFKCVASATALYAGRITYLLLPDSRSNMDILASKLKAISSYFDYRGNECAIDVIAVIDDDLPGEIATKIQSTLDSARIHGHITSHSIRRIERSKLIQTLQTIVTRTGASYYDGTELLTDSGMINGKAVAAISEVLPYFEFDSYNRAFTNCVGCDYLNYIDITSFIQVEDMFALMNAHDKEFNYPNFEKTYTKFWEIYNGDAIEERDLALCARAWNKVSIIIRTGGRDNLRLKNVSLGTTDSAERRVIFKMLNALSDRGYLENLYIDRAKNAMSATITNQTVKDMFVASGMILEIYCFFEACKTCLFDDVQTGYRFNWEFDDVTNELDLVLTKGYRSILIECKSIASVDEGIYLTLDSLGDHFGINYAKILILVTDTTTPSYGQFVSRGNQMDIITISTRKELEKIGERLVEIIGE
ncbi:hypothetical protein SAMN02910456_01230 [Ruminococcaceae bacterium YRB3002]|nr:hypothetical protein SAMN02910456_01230 [Ruminococcaceae bacterium YRB3002]